MSTELTRDAFEQHEGSTFAVYLDESSVIDLELMKVNDYSNDTLESFSLMFKGGPEVALGGTTYKVQHSAIGDFELFLSQVNETDPEANFFESVFSHIKED